MSGDVIRRIFDYATNKYLPGQQPYLQYLADYHKLRGYGAFIPPTYLTMFTGNCGMYWCYNEQKFYESKNGIDLILNPDVSKLKMDDDTCLYDKVQLGEDVLYVKKWVKHDL